MNKATRSELGELHGLLATHFKKMLESKKELSASELSVIASFLKQNDVSADITESAPMQDLVSKVKEKLESKEVTFKRVNAS